jgi:hypothetical protein
MEALGYSEEHAAFTEPGRSGRLTDPFRAARS